jgi:hypothetical protein
MRAEFGDSSHQSAAITDGLDNFIVVFEKLSACFCDKGVIVSN